MAARYVMYDGKRYTIREQGVGPAPTMGEHYAIATGSFNNGSMFLNGRTCCGSMMNGGIAASEDFHQLFTQEEIKHD